MRITFPRVVVLLGAFALSACDFNAAAQDPLPKANATFAHREGRILNLRGDPSAIKSSGVLSKDGRHLFGLWSSYDSHDRIIIYDLQTMKEVKRIGEPLADIGEFYFSAAVSLDEKVVAAAEKPRGTVQVYDVATAKSIGKFTIKSKGAPSDAKILSLTFSPDGDIVYAVNAGGIVAGWSIKTGKYLFQTSTATKSAGPSCVVIAACHDGKRLVGVGDAGYLRVLDAANGNELAKLDVDNVPLYGSSATGLRTVNIAPNDRDAIVCDTYRGIWHVDLTNQKVRQVVKTGANERIGGMALSPSGTQIMFNDAGEKYHALSVLPVDGKRKPAALGFTGAPRILAVSHAGDRVLLQDNRILLQWGLPKK